MVGEDDEAASVAATGDAAVGRIEIVAERRRAHPGSFRAMVVAESLRPDTRVRDLARRHGICPSLIYRWRRLVASPCPAVVSGFVPLGVVPVSDRSTAAAPAIARGTIRIELADGVRVTVDDGVSATSLRRVIAVLRG